MFFGKTTRLHLKPMLALPLPVSGINVFLWIYRLLGNGGICLMAYTTIDTPDLVWGYSFGVFMTSLTITFEGLMFFFLWNFFNADMFENALVVHSNTFESLLQHKAYFDILECMQFGLISIQNTWVLVFVLFLFYFF